MLLTWYGKRGKDGGGEDSTPPPALAAAKMVRVAGDAGRYTVECLVIGSDTAQVCLVDVSGRLPTVEELARPDSGITVVPKIIHPFADSLRAVLVMFEGITVLLCDSSVFAPRPAGERSPFWERLDLVVIPPASEESVLLIREQFRPRFLAAAPPCTAPPAQNIVCGAIGSESGGDDLGGNFRYDFEIRRGKLEAAGVH